LALPVAARNGRFRFPKLNVVGSNPISRSNVSEATRRGIDLVTPQEFIRRERFDPRPAMRRFFSGWTKHA